MIRIVRVSHHERVALLRNGRFVRLLGPGRHLLFTLGALVELVRFDLKDPVHAVGADDVLPADLDGAEVVEVSADERLVVTLGGTVTHVVMPGRVRIWRAAGLRVQHVRVSDPPRALGPEEVWHAGPGIRAPWFEVSAEAHRVAVLLRQGEPVSVLPAGRYRSWADAPYIVTTVSLERRELDVAAQDLLTQDSIAVRLKPAASFRVADPVRFLAEPKAQEAAYVAVQLGLREIVAERTLDALLQDREALSGALLERARAHLPPVGIALESAAVKDVTLPGEMKDLLNRVTLARKEAEAQSIRRREEVAHTRQLANTAKLLEGNPVLMRLKEIEAMGELVAKVDKLVVVGGADLAKAAMLREVDG